MRHLQTILTIAVLFLGGLTTTSLSASIIFQSGSGVVELSYDDHRDTIQATGTGSSDRLFIEDTDEGMFNDLRWNFNSDSAHVISKMSGGDSLVAFAEYASIETSKWFFEISDTPLDYFIYASVGQFDSRFQDVTTGLHLLPGDGSWIYEGTYTGSLLVGHSYLLELRSNSDNSLSGEPGGDSYFTFQVGVPAPSTKTILLLALLGFGFSRKVTSPPRSFSIC